MGNLGVGSLMIPKFVRKEGKMRNLEVSQGILCKFVW